MGSKAIRTAALPEADLVAWVAYLTCTVLFVAFVRNAWTLPILDPDYWWLRWAGEQILHGAYPHANLLSWTAPSTAWVTHEPLVEVIYALAGDAFAPLVRALLISATALLLCFVAWRPHSAVATVLAFGWVTLLILYGRSERALSWGNLMLIITVALLDGRASRWRFGAAAIVVAVWANLHGSFVVGIFLIAVFSWQWGVIAAALSLVNPAGWRLWELTLGYGTSAGTKPFVHQALPEWFAPDLADPWSVLRVGLLLLGGALILWQGPWRGRIIWASLAVLGLRHQRFIEIAAIATLPWFAAALARVLPARRLPSPVPLCAATLIGLAVFLPRTNFDPATFPPNFPFDEVANRRVWNDYRAGGFLGYHGVKVFWDQRVDCYPIDVLIDGSLIEEAEKDRMSLLDKWKIDSVVTAHSSIATELEGAGWTLLGRYGEWRLYRRTT